MRSPREADRLGHIALAANHNIYGRADKRDKWQGQQIQTAERGDTLRMALIIRLIPDFHVIRIMPETGNPVILLRKVSTGTTYFRFIGRTLNQKGNDGRNSALERGAKK